MKNIFFSNSLGVILFIEDNSASVNEIMVKKGMAMIQNRTFKNQLSEHSQKGSSHMIKRELNDYSKCVCYEMLLLNLNCII